MNRSEIVRAISHTADVPSVTVERVLDQILDLITLNLAAGEEVTLRGFGRFEVRVAKEMHRRNPKTGEPVHVPAKNAIKFSAAPALKGRVNSPDGS